MKEQAVDMIDHTLIFSDMITWNEENVGILQLLHGRSKSTKNNLVARPRQLSNQLNAELSFMTEGLYQMTIKQMYTILKRIWRQASVDWVFLR